MRAIWVRKRSVHLRHQLGHDLIVAENRKRGVQCARDAAWHFVGLSVFHPQDAAKHRLRERPTVRHKFLAKDAERLWQGVLCCPAQRLFKPIAANVLHAEFSAHNVRPQFLQRGEVVDIREGANPRAG